MKIPVDVSNLPASVRDCLIQSMKPKFHGYFEFTRDTRRSIPRWDSGGKAFFEYPNASMISDITMLWTLLNELYENIKSSVVDVAREIAQLFAANPGLDLPLQRILTNGEYWRTGSSQPPSFSRVSNSNIAKFYPEVWKTLRNGFSHFHWRYTNISAQQYWNDQQWDTQSTEPTFNLLNRDADNYTGYVVDAKPPWNPGAFWSMRDLRIIVMKYDTFRYWLFVFLNLLLNNEGKGVFGHVEVITA